MDQGTITLIIALAAPTIAAIAGYLSLRYKASAANVDELMKVVDSHRKQIAECRQENEECNEARIALTRQLHASMLRLAALELPQGEKK